MEREYETAQHKSVNPVTGTNQENRKELKGIMKGNLNRKRW
jgi:hypothetical protein